MELDGQLPREVNKATLLSPFTKSTEPQCIILDFVVNEKIIYSLYINVSHIDEHGIESTPLAVPVDKFKDYSLYYFYYLPAGNLRLKIESSLTVHVLRLQEVFGSCDWYGESNHLH